MFRVWGLGSRDHSRSLGHRRHLHHRRHDHPHHRLHVLIISHNHRHRHYHAQHHSATICIVIMAIPMLLLPHRACTYHNSLCCCCCLNYHHYCLLSITTVTRPTTTTSATAATTAARNSGVCGLGDLAATGCWSNCRTSSPLCCYYSPLSVSSLSTGYSGRHSSEQPPHEFRKRSARSLRDGCSAVLSTSYALLLERCGVLVFRTPIPYICDETMFVSMHIYTYR